MNFLFLTSFPSSNVSLTSIVPSGLFYSTRSTFIVFPSFSYIFVTCNFLFPLTNSKKLDSEYSSAPFKIEFLLSSPSFERVISPFAKNLKKLGIETSVRTVDASQYIKRQEVFDFDILVWNAYLEHPVARLEGH